MQRNILILIAAILAGALITYMLDYRDAAPEVDAASFQKGEIVSDFIFYSLDGNKGKISDFRGKIVVLNFWASWCAPCLKEMPYFINMADEYADDVIFIGLSNDFKEKSMTDFLEKLEKQNPFMDSNNVHFSFDENAQITRNIFNVFKLPETIIIDQDGVMREKLIGADWDYENLKGIIKRL